MDDTIYKMKNKSIVQAIEKIRAFSSLKPGWRFGEGEKIQDSIITYSIHLLSFLHLQLNGLGQSYGFKVNALPNVDGGVIISLGKYDDFIELVINTDYTIDLTREKGIGVDYTILCEDYAIPPKNLNIILTHLYSICHLSEPFISGITMRTNNDSPAKCLETTKEVYPYLMRPVPSVEAEMCVSTY